MQLKPRKLQGLKPVALAAGLLMGAQPALPATVKWVGPNASFWDLVANWDMGLPGLLDDVDLVAFDTTFRSGTVGVRSFNGSGRLSLTGGRLSVSDNSFIGLLTLGGGTLAGAGNVTVSGAATFSGGQMLGTGTTVLNGLATVSSLDLDEGRSLQAKGGLSFAASASIDLNPNYTDSTAHGRLVNAATSTLTDNGGLSVYASNYGGNENGANARFVNAGTFNKGGAATSIISVGFENSGSVNVNQGTLRLSGGSTHTGGSVGGAGQLQFSGGTHSFNAASSINTANVLFSSGTVTINGSYNVSGTSTFSGGDVTLPGVITSLGHNLVVNGGTANLGANNISVDSLNLSSGSIRGTGSLTVPSGGTASLTGGQMLGTGTTFINTALSLGSLALDEGRTLQANAGLTFAASASIDLNPNYTDSTAHGRLVNAATSTITDNGGLSVYASNYGGNENGANARFVNEGTYNKGGAAASVISVGFDNSGTVNVNQGTLRLSGGSTHTGATVGGAGQLQFSGGTHSFNAASTLSTADVLFSSGTVTIGGTYNVSGTSTFSGGDVTLPGVITSLGQNLVVNGGAANLGANNISVNSLSLSSGSIRGTGSLTVPGTGTASITGGQMLGTGTTFINTALTLAGLALDEGRTLQASAGLTFTASASIDLNPNYTDSTAHGRLVNAATSTITDNGGLSVYASNYGGNENGANARFVNEGTYNKGGAAASVISVGFDNSGTVNVNQGTLRLSGGSTHTGATVGGAGQLQFSGGTHSFNAASTLSTADVLFSSGTVTIGGTYNVSGTSTFSGGDVTLPGVITSLGQNLVVNGGAANLGANNISVNSLSLSSGSIRGTGSLTVPGTGTASITGGQMLGTGTTFINTALTLAGLALDEGRTLQASAGLTFTASASIDLNPNYTDSTAHGRLVNAATSTITDNGGLSVYASNYGGNENGANARFVNEGTFNKGGATTSVISVGFDNSGTVNVNQGTLRLSGGGAHSGSFAVAAGTTLDLSNGTHALTNAAGPTGSGRLLISGATVNLAGSLDLAGLVDQSGGSFNLGGGNHQAGSLTLRGGVLSGTGELRVAGDTALQRRPDAGRRHHAHPGGGEHLFAAAGHRAHAADRRRRHAGGRRRHQPQPQLHRQHRSRPAGQRRRLHRHRQRGRQHHGQQLRRQRKRRQCAFCQRRHLRQDRRRGVDHCHYV
jgi:fibronectin-binding autotransporter adhesin